MPDRPDRLVVWYGRLPVAELIDRDGEGVTLEYRGEAFDHYGIGTPLLSCSLPLEIARRVDATNFFEGLLPEGVHRNSLAALAGVAASDTFGLLARFGRDVAGALVVADLDWAPDDNAARVVPLSEEDLANEVAELPDRSIGIHDDSELSLAGMQDKMTLSRRAGGAWGRPVHGQPSTHILKLDHRTYRGLVEAEAEALRLARAVGLTDVEIEVADFDGVKVLIVSRFDRTVDRGQVRRLHQEDACQALDVPPRLKYEVGRPGKRPGGGPELVRIAQLLDRYAADPLSQLDRLVAVVTFTALIGNADAHGKNIAFLHPTPGQIVLAPLYDTVPTALWPRLSKDAAMSINGMVSLDTVTLRTVVSEAGRWKHPADRAEQSAVTTARALVDAVEDGVIDADTRLAERVRSQADVFLG